MGFRPSEQAPGFRPTTLPPTCRAAATLCDFLPRVLRLDISKEIGQRLSCEVSAMMMTARGGKATNHLYTAPRPLCLDLNIYYWTVDRPRSSISTGGWRRPEGVDKSAGVLTCWFQGVDTSPPLLVWLPYRGQ